MAKNEKIKSEKIKSKPKEMQGKVEKAVGKAIKHDRLTAKGKADETSAKSGGSVRQAKKDAKKKLS